MTRLSWDAPGTRRFESGVDRGVLYPAGSVGVPWNGLTAVTNTPIGAEPRNFYVDGVKYISAPSTEEFEGTIEAFTYPDEFTECDGTRLLLPGFSLGQQRRKSFHLVYRSKVGDDIGGQDAGYKLHIVYNALAAPSQTTYTTLSDSPEAMTLSWEFTTTPIHVGLGFKPTAHLTVDSTRVVPSIIEGLEELLYGTDHQFAKVPTPAEMLELFATNGELEVIPLTGGGYRIQGGSVEYLGFGVFEIDDSAVVENDDGSFTVI